MATVAKVPLTQKQLERLIDAIKYSMTGYANTPDKANEEEDWDLIRRLSLALK